MGTLQPNTYPLKTIYAFNLNSIGRSSTHYSVLKWKFYDWGVWLTECAIQFSDDSDSATSHRCSAFSSSALHSPSNSLNTETTCMKINEPPETRTPSSLHTNEFTIALCPERFWMNSPSGHFHCFILSAPPDANIYSDGCRVNARTLFYKTQCLLFK